MKWMINSDLPFQISDLCPNLNKTQYTKMKQYFFRAFFEEYNQAFFNQEKKLSSFHIHCYLILSWQKAATNKSYM